MKFSKNKFQTLTATRQIKKYLDFISLIEQNWADECQRNALLGEFEKCLSYSGDASLRQTHLVKSSLREFIRSIMHISQKYDESKQDHDLIINSTDGIREVQKNPIYLVLSDLRSAFNIGSIFRSAECFGVSEVILVGYTAGKENRKVIKTSMNCAEYVPSRHFDDFASAAEYLHSQSITIYALETVAGVGCISEEKLIFPAAFVVGNEALGLSKENLRLADKILQISLSGWKNSLNVGVSAAICCYEASRQLS